MVRSVPQRQIHHCCHGTGGASATACAVHRLPNCLNSHIKNLAGTPKPTLLHSSMVCNVSTSTRWLGNR